MKAELMGVLGLNGRPRDDKISFILIARIGCNPLDPLAPAFTTAGDFLKGAQVPAFDWPAAPP